MYLDMMNDHTKYLKKYIKNKSTTENQDFYVIFSS
jgi:hypothetical protein